MTETGTEKQTGEGPVERIGAFPADKLSDLFTSLAPQKNRLILMYAKDGQIVCDRTDLNYLSERNRRRAENAFAKGLIAGKAEISRAKFRDGYFIGYREGKEGLPCRDPDASRPEDSLTSCDFQCRLCVYACPQCGHCTYYDRAGTEASPPENDGGPAADANPAEPDRPKKEKGRKKQV